MSRNRKKGGGRGIIVDDFYDDVYDAGIGADTGGLEQYYHTGFTNDAISQSRSQLAGRSSGGASRNRLTHQHVYRPPVDPVTLRRAYMLQNFQFILRSDLLQVKSSLGLPQGQRRLIECLRSGDALIPWEAVHSVVMRGTLEQYECPICLELPTAPRITECGHAFCLPCAAQYLHNQKKNDLPRACPVCHSAMTLFSLRPCTLRLVSPPSVGQTARFDLFKRERHSCVLRRYDDTTLAEDGASDHSHNPSLSAIEKEMKLPLYSDPSAVQSRYVLTTPQYEAQQRMMDATGISEKLRTLEENTLRPFTLFDAETERFLLESLNEATKEHKEMSPSLVRSSPSIAPRPPDRTNTSTGVGAAANDPFELYAEAEGQPFFLHMTSVKMLKHDAKLRNAPLPESVSGKVEEMVSFTQDEETRRIYKVFAHIPLHGTIKLCVLDLHDVVLPETMEAFSETLAEMSNQRKIRKAAEDKSATEDASWKEYLMRYTANSSPADLAAGSDVSYDTDSLPYLQLPSVGSAWSDHGLLPSTLDTRQRATKRQDQMNALANAAAAAGAAHNDEESSPMLPTQSHMDPHMIGTPKMESERAGSTTTSCWSTGKATSLFSRDRGK